MTDVSGLDQRAVSTLLTIMRALRDPSTGCPWDVEQSFETIAPYTIEEAYEVSDAIDRRNMPDLCDELGDLLLQVVYHSQMASELGHFAFEDVVEAVNRKMIRRHPHVFGDAASRPANLPKGFWEDMKANERLGKPDRSSLLDSVPQNLPALTRALKLQAKAAKVGFDWPDISFVEEKISEELAELKGAEPNARLGEFGDILFAVVNFARHMDIDPETALRATNQKFYRRFKFIEDSLKKLGKSPEGSDLQEMDALWDEAKAKEKALPDPAP